MQIRLNGDAKELPRLPVTVTHLLEFLQVDASQVAVEKNLEIIPRSRYDAVMIEADDTIELVEFVGGG